MSRLIFVPGAFIAAFTLLVGMLAAAPFTSAQEGTPDAPPPEGGGEVRAEIEAHPAHIHSGTCEELGDIVYPLEDLRAVAAIPITDATPPPVYAGGADAEDLMGPQGIAAHSSTEVDVALDDLLEGDYAINVHASAENLDTYLACGEITGSVEDGELFVELNEVGTSGFEGVAELTNLEDTTTFVNAVIFPDNPPSGTPLEATPAD